MGRLEKIRQLLHTFNVHALIIDKPIDLYYLLGMELSLGRLVVEESGAHLFVDGRYFEACSGLTSVSVHLTSGYGKESSFLKWWPLAGKRVGFDAYSISYSEFETLKMLPSDFVPLNGPILQLREIKEGSEIHKLREAAELGSRGFDYVVTLLKEGVSEKEVAAELEIFWLKEGGEKLAFAPHVAFGEGSSQPHYHVSERRLKKGDLVLIDIGVVLDHYHSDMTRVVAYGQPVPELVSIYQIVYEAYTAAVRLCKPGVLIGDLDRAARDLIEQAGLAERFPHGLGHGVGLEIHEPPRLRSVGPDASRPLREGMVITIEPGIYLPGKGGVRLEDMILITNTGCENLTNRPLRAKLPLLYSP